MLYAQRPDSNVDGVAESCMATLLNTVPDMSALRSTLAQRNGFDSDTAERLIYEIVASINLKLFHPISALELLLVEGCNLACRYCFESAVLRTRGRGRLMSNETIRRSIDLLFDYSAPKASLWITLFGGEPLINFEGVQFATEYLESKSAATGQKYGVGITTNGVLLTERIVDFLAAHKVRVLLSVDGLAPTHDRYRVDRRGAGTFKRVVSALRTIKSRQPWVGVKMTVMPSEACNLFANVRGLRDLGANQFLIGHASGVQWPEEAISAYLEQWGLLRDWYREHSRNDVRINELDEISPRPPVFGCRAARSGIAVNANGEITGCSRIATLDGKSRIGKLGDVRSGLYGIGNRMEMLNCQRLIENCDAVGLAKTYMSGCFATNYEACGDLYVPNLIEQGISKRLRQIRI